MYKAAVMGDWDAIYGFSALGLKTVAEDGSDPEKAAQKLKELAEQQYAVIYITEPLAAKIPEAVEEMRLRAMPALILIPGISGNTGEGMKGVSRTVEQAVGSDILFGNH